MSAKSYSINQQSDGKYTVTDSAPLAVGLTLEEAKDLVDGLMGMDDDADACRMLSRFYAALGHVQDALACYRDKAQYVHPEHGAISLEELKYLVVDPLLSGSDEVQAELEEEAKQEREILQENEPTQDEIDRALRLAIEQVIIENNAVINDLLLTLKRATLFLEARHLEKPTEMSSEVLEHCKSTIARCQ